MKKIALCDFFWTLKYMGKNLFYTLLSHTADLGMIVKGDSYKELFKHAGAAMMNILIKGNSPSINKITNITINGSDLPDLLVKWLSEILYLFEGERLVVTEINIESMSYSNISATLKTVEFDFRYHEVLREIKAVTYHQIDVREEKGVWTARVIFDL